LQEDIEESIPEIEAFFKERGGIDATRLLEKITNRFLPHLKQIVQECFIPTEPDSFVCLVHSNFWHQNLLFKNTTKTESQGGAEAKTEVKVKTEDKKSESCCRILDWENVNVSQPMLDVACLLFRSANPKVRRDHLDEFLELYTNTFQVLLVATLDINYKVFITVIMNISLSLQNMTQFLRIPTVYDLNYFKQKYRKCAIFPILLVMATMALTLCDETAMELFMEGLLDCEQDHLNYRQ
jgi:thiamine kinase-like enzyme